jgi:hypothetical protein
MDLMGDSLGHKVLPIVIHGDAAFAGQGIVYETMQMAKLEAYQTGGSVNVICNNQIGFTATPQQGRSTRYASDLGKAFGCPIFHVNADDVEAVNRVFELAGKGFYSRASIFELAGKGFYSRASVFELPGKGFYSRASVFELAVGLRTRASACIHCMRGRSFF